MPRYECLISLDCHQRFDSDEAWCEHRKEVHNLPIPGDTKMAGKGAPQGGQIKCPTGCGNSHDTAYAAAAHKATAHLNK